MPLFPLLLAIHIMLAIGLLLPSILLPFAHRARRPRSGGSAGILMSAGPELW